MENNLKLEISHKEKIDEAFEWWYKLSYEQRDLLRMVNSCGKEPMTVKQVLNSYQIYA